MSVSIVNHTLGALNVEVRSDDTHFTVYRNGRPVAGITRRRVYAKGPAFTVALVNIATADGNSLDLGGFDLIRPALRAIFAALKAEDAKAEAAKPAPVGSAEWAAEVEAAAPVEPVMPRFVHVDRMRHDRMMTPQRAGRLGNHVLRDRAPMDEVKAIAVTRLAMVAGHEMNSRFGLSLMDETSELSAVVWC